MDILAVPGDGAARWESEAGVAVTCPAVPPVEDGGFGANPTCLDGHRDPVLWVDADGVVAYANPAARDFAGWPDDPRGMHVSGLVAALDADSWRACWAVISEGPDRRHTLHAEHRGHLLRLDLHYHVADGGSYGIVFLHDLDGAMRRLFEEKTQAEQGIRSRDLCLASVAHDLRAPLHAILGMAQALQTTALDREQQDMVGNMNQAGDVMVRLLDDLLLVTRIGAGNFRIIRRPFCPRYLLKDMEAMFRRRAEERGLDFTVHLEDEDGDRWLMGDELRIKQILINLLGNAFKFTDRGGIALRADPGGLDCDGRTVLCLEVSDTGPGIPEDMLSSVFDPFVQAHGEESAARGGVGLGLNIVKRVAGALGGVVEARSRMGEGSVFTARLPCDPCAAPPKAPEERVKDCLARLRGRCVLCVDDDRTSLEATARMLEKEGLLVEREGDGPVALDKALGRDYDLVILDLHLPGLGGLDISRRLRRAGRRMPIVLLTGDVLRMEQGEMLSAGLNDVLNKPLPRKILRRMLVTHLQDQAAAGA